MQLFYAIGSIYFLMIDELKSENIFKFINQI